MRAEAGSGYGHGGWHLEQTQSGAILFFEEDSGMKKGLLMVLAAGMMLTALPVSAMNVKISGEACPLTAKATLEEAAETLNLETTEMEVYGYMKGDLIAFTSGATLAFVDKGELADKLPDIPVDQLPSAEGLTDIVLGTKGENVIALQKALIKLGYLTGTADGSYGQGSMGAVKQFQTDHRIEPTGTATVYTQMAAQMLANGLPDVLETTYPTVHSVEEKFAAIISRTDMDLSPYLDSKWKFSYDKFENRGTLDSSVVLGTYENLEGADLDKISMTASLKIVISDNAESGMIDFLPVLAVDSEGAFRPYVQDVIFVTKDSTMKSGQGVSSGELAGASLRESSYVPLSDEMLKALAGKKATEIRIEGKNQSFDIKVAKAARSKAEKFAKTITKSKG